MSTTDSYQTIPNYFDTIEECKAASRKRVNTNKRYVNFFQTQFTAGDPEQFQRHRDFTNGDPCKKLPDLHSNIFNSDQLFEMWEGNRDVTAIAVDNTFHYMFNKLKKGIYVKIQDNKLRVFLPFSKHSFVNEWGHLIKVDKRFSKFADFIAYINRMENRRSRPDTVNEDPSLWYSNNCLLRYEREKVVDAKGRAHFNVHEGDNNVPGMKHMLLTLCKTRELPDIEFFINRRDFPVMKRDGTEPYDCIWGPDHPLVSHAYDKYLPILSMVTTDKFADVPIPTGEDWVRVSGKFFKGNCRNYKYNFELDWNEKIPTAVFRGTSTGCGVTPKTNQRLRLAEMNSEGMVDDDGVPFLNAGVTSWNLRPRKLADEKYIKTIEIGSLGFELSSYMTPEEQSKYKYVLNVDGHVSAFRLSLELGMGSCLLLVESAYRMWIHKFLKPYVHFVPIKSDLSDLIDRIKWCKANDSECQKIAANALEFYTTFLQKDGCLDYMQKILVELKKEVGVYLYNVKTPLDVQYDWQLEFLKQSRRYPTTTSTGIYTIPPQGRSYSLMRGLDMAMSFAIDTAKFAKSMMKFDKPRRYGSKLLEYFTFAKFKVIVKKNLSKAGNHEQVNEAFIGATCINPLLEKIPNFNYTFNTETTDIISEYIRGPTFSDWISSPAFSMTDYLKILTQISLALCVAQEHCAFTHYDLTPWNIILSIMPKNTEVPFDYVISSKAWRHKSKIIPIIIDYGKSHAIYNGCNFGIIDQFRTSTIQDVITILLTSIEKILHKRLNGEDTKVLMKLANFISGTGYRKNVFKSENELKSWISKATKYSEIIKADKCELEERSPWDFVKFLMTLDSGVKNSIERVHFARNIMGGGNARQVYDFILAGTTKARVKSYTDFYTRFIHSTLPQPRNKLLVYYVAQRFDTAFRSTMKSFRIFLKKNAMNEKSYEWMAIRCIDFIKKVYMPLLEAKSTILEYEIPARLMDTLPYSSLEFLNPRIIAEKSSNFVQSPAIARNKIAIESVFFTDGEWKMADADRIFYTESMKDLFDISTLKLLVTESASITTKWICSKVYEADLLALPKCAAVEKYRKLYEDML